MDGRDALDVVDRLTRPYGVVDLDLLCVALEDRSYESSWWFDPGTGEVRSHHDDVDDESVEDLEEAMLLFVEPLEPGVGYRDMEIFVAMVSQRRAADLLRRAITGRGAFRRFKDTLFEFPELRAQWFAFHDARMRRRAISWLTDHGVISAEAAEQAAAASPDPVIGNGVVDIDALVSDVVADLRALYGEGLVQVLVYGSWARDEAGEDSDVGLLVVLADVVSPWAELRRMDEILWRHTDRSGVVVSAFPVSIEEFEHPASPVLIRAKAEAVPVA